MYLIDPLAIDPSKHHTTGLHALDQWFPNWGSPNYFVGSPDDQLKSNFMTFKTFLTLNWPNWQILRKKEANIVKIADLQAHNASHREAL